MNQFNFDLQRFPADINSYETVTTRDTDAVTKIITPFKNKSGFAIIRQNKIFFSGRNSRNRFGFDWEDRFTDRNLLYRSKVTSADKSVAGAAMDAHSTGVVTTDRKIFVCGKVSYSKFGKVSNDGTKVVSGVAREWIEVPAPDTRINNIYMGYNFTLVTTDRYGYVYGAGNTKYWLPNATNSRADTYTKIPNIQGICKVAISLRTVFLLTLTGEVKVFASSTSVVRDKNIKNAKTYTTLLTNVIDMDCDNQRAVFVTKDNKVYACGRFECFDPWNNENVFVNTINECKTLKNLRVVKARVYGHGIIVNTVDGKVYAIGNNVDGRISPSISSEIIKSPEIIGYPLDGHRHAARDIKCFYNTSTHGKGTIFFGCGCHTGKVWCYGLGYGSELGRDTFITDCDDLNMDNSWTYSDRIKIFGHDDALFIAKPDGVYAAGYNYVGELGAAEYELTQPVLIKVFGEQVDKIAIGKQCCLIQTHGTVFAAGKIAGGAVNSTEFVPVILPDNKTDRVQDINVIELSFHSIPIIKKTSGMYAAGRNMYRFINNNLSNNKNVTTFTKISLYGNISPATMFDNGRRGGFFYKLPASGAGTNNNKIICFGIYEFYSGRRDTVLEGTSGEVLTNYTICCDGRTDIKHVGYGSLPKTVVYTFTNGRVRIYTRYARMAGISKNYNTVLAVNKGHSEYCIIDSDITDVKYACPGDNFIAYLTNSGNVWITGRNRYLRTNDSSDITKFQLVDSRSTSNSKLSNIVDMVVLKKGIVLLQEDRNKNQTVLFYGLFTSGTGGTGFNSSVITLKEPLAYLTSELESSMIVEAGRHMSFFCVPYIISGNVITELYAVGHNHDGGMGNGKQDNTKSDINDKNALVNFPGGTITAIYSSNYQDHRTYIIDENGSVYASGHNAYGQLGVGDTNNRTSFTQITFPYLDEDEVIVKVAIGNYHTLFLTSGGSVYGCGGIKWGVLGNNFGTADIGDNDEEDNKATQSANILTPILIAGKADVSFNGTENEVDLADEEIVDIAAGTTFSLLLSSEGTIYMAGKNRYGAFGDGSRLNTKYLTFTENTKVKNAKSIHASGYNSFYITNNGYLYGAGRNQYKQLGFNDTNNRTTYTYVRGGYRSNQTIEFGHDHGGFVKKGGYAYTFGRNDGYQLGLNHMYNTQFATVSDVTNASAISCGYDHTLVMTQAGLVYSFGRNMYKQLGRSTKNEGKYTPGYVFCVFPNVIAYVPEIEGTFKATNKKKYFYRFCFDVKSSDRYAATFNVRVLAGCDEDSDTGQVEYAIDKKDNTNYSFDRYTVNTAEDVLTEAAQTLLTQIKTQVNPSVYELDNVNPIIGYIEKDGIGTYYYIVEATIGSYTPHSSTSATVTIATKYRLVRGKTYDSSYNPSYNTNFTDLGDVATSITIRGGRYCGSDYGTIETVMNQHKKAFCDYVKQIQPPLGEGLRVDNKTGTYTSNKTNLSFSYTFRASFDSNNFRPSTALSTEMTVNYSVKCTSNNKSVNFTYTGIRSFVFTYDNKSTVTTEFNNICNRILKGTKENNKTIVGMESYLYNWIYISLPSSYNSWNSRVSFIATGSGISYSLQKSAKMTNNEISYGVTCIGGLSQDYTRIMIINTSTWTVDFRDISMGSQNVLNRNNLLSYLNTSNTLTITPENFSSYETTITNNLNKSVDNITSILNEVLGFIREPRTTTVIYNAPNGSKYPITVSLDVGNYTPFKDWRVRYRVTVYWKNPTTNRDIRAINQSYIISARVNAEEDTKYRNYTEIMKNILTQDIKEVVNNLSGVLGPMDNPVITGSTDTTYWGVYYYRCYVTGLRYTPHFSTSVTCTIKLNYGTRNGNYPATFSNFTTKTVTIRGGSHFASDKTALTDAMNAAINAFKASFNPAVPTCPKAEYEKNPYVHTIAAENNMTDTLATYYIRTVYSLTKDRSGYSYTCTATTQYGLGNKDKDYKYTYTTDSVTINSTNYTSFPNNIKNAANSSRSTLKNRVLYNYLGKIVADKQPNAYSNTGSMVITSSKESFAFPQMNIYCENTQLSYPVRFVKSIRWDGDIPERSRQATIGLRIEYYMNNKWIPHGSERHVFCAVTIYNTMISRLNTEASKLLVSLDRLLSTFIGPITTPDEDSQTYTSRTGIVYYTRHKFHIDWKADNYTIAYISIEQEWDTVSNYTNGRGICKHTSTISITAKDYATHTSKIKAEADRLRTRNKAWLDTLVPPVEMYPDYTNNISVVGTNTTYTYWLSFDIIKNTDYTENGTATVAYEIEWKDASNEMARRTYTKQTTTIDKDTYKSRKTKIDSLRTNTIKLLESYFKTLVPPLESQGDIDEVYRCAKTNFNYNTHTEFSITNNTNYTVNGKILVNIVTSWTSTADNGYTDNTTKKITKIEINKNNYKDRLTILRQTNAVNGTIRNMKSYLDTLVPKIENDWFNVLDSGYKHRCSATDTLYFINTQYTISKNSDYKAKGTATVSIQSYWGVNVDKITNKFSTTATHTVDIDNYVTRYDDVMKKGEANRKSLMAWLDKVLPPITEVPVGDIEYHTHTCALTQTTYYIRTAYTVATSNKSYTYNGSAKFKATVTWNTNGSTNYNRTWDASKDKNDTVTIKYTNYNNMETEILEMGSNVRASLAAYLDTLLPPLNDVPDRKYPYIATTTGVIYYKLIDYTITTQSNYSPNGKAVITVTPKWGRTEQSKYPNTVSTLTETLTITLNNYAKHETLAADLLKSVETKLNNHLNTLLGPILTIPDYIGDYKVSSVNGISFRVKVMYGGDFYDKYEVNGTHNITLTAQWDANQDPSNRKLVKTKQSFTVPTGYNLVTIGLANYYKYASVVEEKGLELATYIEKYLDTLIGKIQKPESDKVCHVYFSDVTKLKYFLKTTYEIDEYTPFGVYNEPNTSGKFVSVTVTTVCGESKNYELGEYVDFSDPRDSDYWFEKELRIYNTVFADHVDRLEKLGEIQREQIAKKLDNRVGIIKLPGTAVDANTSYETVPVYTATSTGIKYYIRTKYEKMNDNDDQYDNIKVSTFWSKYTDAFVDDDPAYSRPFPDHLATSNAATYTIYTVTAKNYVNHTQQLMDLGEYQRNHESTHTATGDSTGLFQYLETLIGVVVKKVSNEYKTLKNRVIAKSLTTKYCIVIPSDHTGVYDTKSGKKFYLKTTYTHVGNVNASDFTEDTNEKSYTLNYTTIYSPNSDYSSSTEYRASSHTITPDNFKTRNADLLACSNNDFTDMVPIFGIWDIKVPNKEVHVYTNLGGIVYYIQIVYTQGTTTNTSNSINYEITYSRSRKISDKNGTDFGPCDYLSGQQGYYIKKPHEDEYIVLDQEARDVTDGSNTITTFDPFIYTINGNNYQGTEDTAEAIVTEANNHRAVLEQYLYVPTVEPLETEPEVYTYNGLSYQLNVTFSHTPDNTNTDETGRNIIYIRRYIDGYKYGDTIVVKYTRTSEAAEKDMKNRYKKAIKELKALCNNSPASQSLTITRHSYSFQIVSNYSKEAGDTSVTMTTQVDGIDFYTGAYKVLTKDVNVRDGFITGLNDLVLNFETYALCLAEMVEDIPRSYSDSFTHPIETSNMSILDVSYSKDEGNPNYRYTIKCDGIEITTFNNIETELFSEGGIEFGTFSPKIVIENNTLNSIDAIKTVLNSTHAYFETEIVNKDGLQFGFRYTVTKDSMSNVAILRIYVDEDLLREYQCTYSYNTISDDRARITNRVALDLVKIKKAIYCELTGEDTEIITTYGDDYEDDNITTSSPEIGETSYTSTTGDVNTQGERKAPTETRVLNMSGVLANHNNTGFSYSYSISFEKEPNNKTVTAIFLFDNVVYKVYTHNAEIDSYDEDINTMNDTMQSNYNTLITMLNYSPSNNETTAYYVDGFDYTCGAIYTKLSNSTEVVINILVDGIVEETISEVVRSHYGEDNQTSLALTPLDDINRIISKVETKISETVATFKGLTKDLTVFSKNGFSFNLSTTYTKNITNHTITMKSFIDNHQYGQTITEELNKTSRKLIDDLAHSSVTYHGRGLSAIENMKLALADVPADVYENNLVYNGFKFNAGVKYSKAKGTDNVFVTKMLDSNNLGDTSTLAFSVNSIDDIKVFGDNLLNDLKQYLSDYCPVDREYNYVPSGSELPFMIRTKYRKAANSNDVYITTSLDNVTYGASSVKTFNINNMSELSTDVDTKEGLLKAQLEKGPKNYNEEFVVKNCVFKLDIKYEKAQDNLRISTSIYLDDVRYGDVRTENFDVSNPKSVCEYPNQVLAELKSLLSDAIPEDIISTYSRGKYTFDMEILFSKSSGSDVITITYKIDSADVYSTSLSTGTLIGG